MNQISPKVFENLGRRIEREDKKRRYMAGLKNMVSAKSFAILLSVSSVLTSQQSCSVLAQEISQEIDGYEAGEVAHAQSIIQSGAFQERMRPFLDELGEKWIHLSDEIYVILSDLYIAQRDGDEAALEYILDELEILGIPERMFIKYGFQSI